MSEKAGRAREGDRREIRLPPAVWQRLDALPPRMFGDRANQHSKAAVLRAAVLSGLNQLESRYPAP